MSVEINSFEVAQVKLYPINQWRMDIVASMASQNAEDGSVPKFGYKLARGAQPSEFDGMDSDAIAQILMIEASILRKYS
jgi:hypothetical protein